MVARSRFGEMRRVKPWLYSDSRSSEWTVLIQPSSLLVYVRQKSTRSLLSADYFFASQVERSVTNVLDNLAPWQQRTKRRAKHNSRWLSTPSPDWNCQWGPSGGRGQYSLHPRHVRASMLPKKRLSTHTMHFRRVTGGIRVSVTQPSTPASMEHRVAIWSFSIFKYQNAPKYRNFYVATQTKHDQSSYFCRDPDDFCWGPAPWAPPWWRGRCLCM